MLKDFCRRESSIKLNLTFTKLKRAIIKLKRHFIKLCIISTVGKNNWAFHSKQLASSDDNRTAKVIWEVEDRDRMMILPLSSLQLWILSISQHSAPILNRSLFYFFSSSHPSASQTHPSVPRPESIAGKFKSNPIGRGRGKETNQKSNSFRTELSMEIAVETG